MEPITFITQETSSPPSSARDAAAIGGAREGMPRQSRIFRIASGGLESKINAFPPGSVFTVPILGKRRLRASCASLVPFRVADYSSMRRR